MKLPYFYLKAGGVEIFQPQNKYHGNNSDVYIQDYENNMHIRASDCPDFHITGGHLWLNGRADSENYRVLKVKKFDRFIDSIRQYNERF